MSPRYTLISLQLLAMLFFCEVLSAQSGPARAELEQFTQGLQSLDARFDQQVINPDGAIEASSDGQVWLRRPAQFRWEYGGDFPELVVADGSTVWLYDESLEQVTVRSQSNLSADTPLTLLTDLSRLDDQFEVRELGDDSGMQLLQLVSRNPDAEFESILLGMRGGVLELMAMEDAFGLRTEIRFREIRRNQVLADDLFRFEIPEGTDVIGELTGEPAENR